MRFELLLLLIVCVSGFSAQKKDYPFYDTSLSVSQRVDDLVSRLTITEKIKQLGNHSPEIPRLGISSCNYWNEGCHGVLRSDATSFPHVIGLSATWDTLLIHAIATAISDEARVLHSEGKVGLHFFTPTMNLGRDPRWGRNEETFGEDAFLTKKMAVNFINGLQGNDSRYLKVAATAKHFVCNNSEKLRRKYSSQVDERSLREFYFPAFKASVDAGVTSIMSAYNGLNGIPCSANKWLLKDVLREEWGFEGYVVSDCDALDFLTSEHRFTTNPTEAAAVASKAGCDLECGPIYQQYLQLTLANKIWNISEATLDTALKRIFRSRILLGEFDPPEMVPYNNIPASLFNSAAHQELSLEAARKSIVLLKNDKSLLPLDTASINSIALIGPFTNRCELGGYSGIPTEKITPLRGVLEYLGPRWKNGVFYTRGCDLTGAADPSDIDRAIVAAVKADVAILFLGTGPANAREEYDLDFTSLPGGQQDLVEAVFSANPNTIVVFITGNPLPISWCKNHIPALVTAWYAGPYQGTAIADVLFGNYNPGGKLTQTWVENENDLPPLEDYSLF
ncbi:MAG: glycoside hydrolase family 3 C-terminal domain-containing protein, partial [Candidatus Pacearchaeota archaeon]|nr:glycoside hydrolase family 3 C-terminal domain-containing protein [Candidatus Pacearchaeota archaeon]